MAALLASSLAATGVLYLGPPPARIATIAVLPLENLSGDPSQQYLADGITNDLVAALAKIGSLRVVAGNSVRPYARQREPVRDLRGGLEADALVEGTVVRSDNRVRINAQLVDARTEAHLWAESYEEDLADVMMLQAKVANAIAGQVRARLEAVPNPGHSQARFP